MLVLGCGKRQDFQFRRTREEKREKVLRLLNPWHRRHDHSRYLLSPCKALHLSGAMTHIRKSKPSQKGKMKP